MALGQDRTLQDCGCQKPGMRHAGTHPGRLTREPGRARACAQAQIFPKFHSRWCHAASTVARMACIDTHGCYARVFSRMCVHQAGTLPYPTRDIMPHGEAAVDCRMGKRAQCMKQEHKVGGLAGRGQIWQALVREKRRRPTSATCRHCKIHRPQVARLLQNTDHAASHKLTMATMLMGGSP